MYAHFRGSWGVTLHIHEPLRGTWEEPESTLVSIELGPMHNCHSRGAGLGGRVPMQMYAQVGGGGS